jgi:hypothetical protein
MGSISVSSSIDNKDADAVIFWNCVSRILGNVSNLIGLWISNGYKYKSYNLYVYGYSFRSSETFVDFYQTTRCQSQKNTALKLTAVGTSSLSLSIINVRIISVEVFATDYSHCAWSPCGKEMPRDSSQRISELHEGNAKEFYRFTFLSSCNSRALMS